MLQLNRQPVDLALPTQAVLAPQFVLIAQPFAQLALGDTLRIADRRDVTVMPVDLVQRLDLLVQGIKTIHPILHFVRMLLRNRKEMLIARRPADGGPGPGGPSAYGHLFRSRARLARMF